MVTFTVHCKKALIFKNVLPQRWGDSLWRRGSQLKDNSDQIVYITRGECQASQRSISKSQVYTIRDFMSLIYSEKSCCKQGVLAFKISPKELERHVFKGFNMCHVLGP